MADQYRFSHDDDGDTLHIDVHTDTDLAVPLLRWRVETTGETGGRGTLTLPDDMPGGFDQTVTEPRFRFHTDVTAISFGGRDRVGLTLPRPLAADLTIKLETMETPVIGGEHICADPAAFPPVIDGQSRSDYYQRLEQAYWSEGEHVMWYVDEMGITIGYQIDDGHLIQRARAHRRARTTSPGIPPLFRH
ncbi:hypothetical protein [Halomarina oriensis]|uniref:Uncharacterized protein n=1 Tax=Halomarina oriensis TaxID=671145 RepID=A0A6B0GKL2_9EURY|nr:hypothetical protein [Halomarina oriensis]MWG35284.1 hypothetical protein [Halomarina oriensis]